MRSIILISTNYKVNGRAITGTSNEDLILLYFNGILGSRVFGMISVSLLLKNIYALTPFDQIQLSLRQFLW